MACLRAWRWDACGRRSKSGHAQVCIMGMGSTEVLARPRPLAEFVSHGKGVARKRAERRSCFLFRPGTSNASSTELITRFRHYELNRLAAIDVQTVATVEKLVQELQENNVPVTWRNLRTGLGYGLYPSKRLYKALAEIMARIHIARPGRTQIFRHRPIAARQKEGELILAWLRHNIT